MNGQETPARICQNSLSDVGGGGACRSGGSGNGELDVGGQR